MFGEPACGEGLLVGGRDKDTAFTVFGSRAAVKAYSEAVGDLLQDGQESSETGRFGDGYFVTERGNEIVDVLEGVTNGGQIFLVFSCGSRVSVFDAVECSANRFVFGCFPNEFVISHSFFE